MSPPPFQLLVEHAQGAPVAVGAGTGRGAADLLRDVASLEAALPAPTPGSEVLIVCEDRYHFAAGLLAAWQRGHAAALPQNAQPETLRQLSQSAQVAACLHDGGLAAGLDVRAIAPAASPAALCPYEAGRKLLTLYTSGSSGLARACGKTAQQLLGEAELLRKTFSIGPQDRVLATVPAHHIYGLLFGVLVPLCSGAAFARSTPLHGEAVAAEARATGATVLVSVPAHLRALVPPSVRLLFSSSAPLDGETARRLGESCPGAWEILGSTETGGIAARRCGARRYRPLEGMVVTEGQLGQLLLDSPLLDADLPRPHPCADRIELFADGSFQHLGRTDGVVKVAGKRVALAELERRLREVPGVNDAAAVAVAADSARGTEIYAAVASAVVTPAGVRQALLQHFDPTVLPRRLRVLPALPRAANGKLSRAALLALFEDRRHFPIRELSRARSAAGEVIELEVLVPPDLLWLRGHFDDFPLLAGVVQLNVLVVGESRRLWPDLRFVRRLSRVKFRRPVQPGETLLLRLARQEAVVTFSLEHDRAACSSGTLEFSS